MSKPARLSARTLLRIFRHIEYLNSIDAYEVADLVHANLMAQLEREVRGKPSQQDTLYGFLAEFYGRDRDIAHRGNVTVPMVQRDWDLAQIVQRERRLGTFRLEAGKLSLVWGATESVADANSLADGRRAVGRRDRAYGEPEPKAILEALRLLGLHRGHFRRGRPRRDLTTKKKTPKRHK